MAVTHGDRIENRDQILCNLSVKIVYLRLTPVWFLQEHVLEEDKPNVTINCLDYVLSR